MTVKAETVSIERGGAVSAVLGFDLTGPPLRAMALLGAVLACLLVWAMVSALWSADPWGSLALAARLAGILAAGLALVAAVDCIVAPHRLVLSLLVGLAVGIAIFTAASAAAALASRRRWYAASRVASTL